MNKIHISTMTGKLQGLLAINTDPLTNTYCQKMFKVKGTICNKCYSIKMLNTYRKSCLPTFSSNSHYLSKSILSITDIPELKHNSIVRFNAHGELINRNHAINCLKIAFYNPTCTFALWTKRPSLVHQAIAYMQAFTTGRFTDNITFVYSSPIINTIVPRPNHFDHVFTVFDHDRPDLNCQGKKCISCMKCYKVGAPILINERLKP